MPSVVLEVQSLSVAASTTEMGTVSLIRDVSLTLNANEVVGLIGESGSGKTTVVRSLIGNLARNCQIDSGRVSIAGDEVLAPGIDRLASVRGKHVGVIFQNAMSALNPLMKIRNQIEEVLERHEPKLNARQRYERIRANLARLGFEHIDTVLRSYPHHLSGGMRQRISIALATVLEPELIIADECTTALDVTTQAEVVHLLEELAARERASLLFVTHDLMLAAELCTRIIVMYAGQVVESGPVEQLLRRPLHPYTQALLQAVPSWGPRRNLRGIPGSPPLVQEEAVGCRFASRCEFAIPACTEQDVLWHDVSEEHGHRCLRVDELFSREAGDRRAEA